MLKKKRKEKIYVSVPARLKPICPRVSCIPFSYKSILSQFSSQTQLETLREQRSSFASLWCKGLHLHLQVLRDTACILIV